MSEHDLENQEQQPENEELETEEQLEAAIAAEEAAQAEAAEEESAGDQEFVEQEESELQAGEVDGTAGGEQLKELETQEEQEEPAAPEGSEQDEAAAVASDEEADEEVVEEPLHPVEIGLDFYLKPLAPRTPVEPRIGLALQQRMYRQLVTLMSTGDVRYNIKGILTVIRKYRKAHFHESMLFRFLDQRGVDRRWRTKFENLMTLLVRMADVADVRAVGKHVNIDTVADSMDSREAAANLLDYLRG